MIFVMIEARLILILILKFFSENTLAGYFFYNHQFFDGVVKSRKHTFFVIPAKAGIQ